MNTLLGKLYRDVCSRKADYYIATNFLVLFSMNVTFYFLTDKYFIETIPSGQISVNLKNHFTTATKIAGAINTYWKYFSLDIFCQILTLLVFKPTMPSH